MTYRSKGYTVILLAIILSVMPAFAKDECKFDVGVTAGSTGVGLELGLTYYSWMRLRIGADAMPHFNVPMSFGVSSYTDGGDVTSIVNKVDKINDLLGKFTGMQIDQRVDMVAHPTMSNFKLLVDFYPIKSHKNFYATVGFYWGPSKIGHIENNIKEMPTLMGIMMYNNMYDYFMNETYWDEPLFDDLYLDGYLGDKIREKFENNGMLGAHLGNFKDGKPYMMEPDKDGVIQANMYVNSFKPYIGAGYEVGLGKGWNFGVDLGMLIWGGVPKILTHSNTNMDNRKVNLSSDVHDIGGKVGDYVRVVKQFPVYPMLTVRLTYRIL